MKTFNRDILIAGAVLLMALALPLSPVNASEPGDKKGIEVIPSIPADKKEDTAPKTEAQGDRKSGEGEKKGPQPVRRKAAKPSEPLPNERLSIRKVLKILKDTKDLSGRNMSGLNLVGVDFSKCNLRGADLSGANLMRADLSESVLERADLSGANMQMTDLRIAGLKGARFNGARLDGAIWEDGTICGKGSTGICRENRHVP